jgi:hypothetical protein
MQRRSLIIALVLTLAVPTLAAEPESGTIDIMRPEQASPVKKKIRHVRRGSSSPVYPAPLPAPLRYNPPPTQSVVTHPPTVPPPLYVPQTGRLLPNLPTVAPSGPNGTETSQDRALRCAHQAGVYGAAAGDRTSYIGSCVNQ